MKKLIFIMLLSIISISTTSNVLSMQIDSQNNPVQLPTCDICQRKFNKESSLHQHLKKIHNIQHTFKCQYCPQTFFRRYHCADHENIHTKKITYNCSNCDYVCYSKFGLDKHQKSHQKKLAAITAVKLIKIDKADVLRDLNLSRQQLYSQNDNPNPNEDVEFASALENESEKFLKQLQFNHDRLDRYTMRASSPFLQPESADKILTIETDEQPKVLNAAQAAGYDALMSQASI